MEDSAAENFNSPGCLYCQLPATDWSIKIGWPCCESQDCTTAAKVAKRLLGPARRIETRGVNQLVTPESITAEALSVLQNSLSVASQINRQYDSQFQGGGKSMGGSTVSVKKPQRYVDDRLPARYRK